MPATSYAADYVLSLLSIIAATVLDYICIERRLLLLCSAVIFQNELSCIHIDAVIDPLSSSGQNMFSQA